MQKSSTGSGEQAAAPISDAAKPDAAAKQEGSSASSSNADPAAVAGQSSAGSAKSSAAGANTASKPRSSEDSPAAVDNDEAAQLKRQLADQDAQINRLRDDQQTAAQREETETAKMREQEQAAAAAAGAAAAQPASPGAASAARSSAAEEAAVFPPNGNAAEQAGAESANAAVPRAAERSVYFGYDQATVPDKYDDMLMANAAYLKAHPGTKVEVQGNCDERGSREYNLALGSRRAVAVKRALELAGADGNRIGAISYGAEKPIALGKDEDSYSRNRRADIVY